MGTPLPFHALPLDDALARLDATPAGLASKEAARRLREHGPNALLVAPPRPAWRILLDQTASLTVALLAGAAALSLVVSDVADALAIGVVLLLDVGLGFVIELRARRSMDALRSLDPGRARVLRDGAPTTCDAHALVPGDVVLLEEGDAVPADMRVLSGAELAANEAPLTGESLPVPKTPDAVDVDALVADRACVLHKGTLVATGSARAVVFATGLSTEIGRVTELVASTEDDATPLERRLAALGRRLVGLSLGVGALVALLGWLRGGEVWLMLQTGIALAVAAVPEGLPVVATITLAVGMRRMARRAALVRRLPAVEALGSVTVVCTDKTGTLTAGEMTAVVLSLADGRVDVTGAGYGSEGELLRDGVTIDAARMPSDAALRRALEVAALCNRAHVERVAPSTDGGAPRTRPASDDTRAGRDPAGTWRAGGDPTEAALLVLARKAGIERDALRASLPEVGELPFRSERMLMATFHLRPDGRVFVAVKGAPERVLACCALDDVARADVLRENGALAQDGLRVLALACGEIASDAPRDESALAQLRLLGLVGLLDPPAADVAGTLATLRTAGIRVIMITGDQAATARGVARALGLLATVDDLDRVLDGAELLRLDDAALAERVRHVSAFSRVSPRDKLRIVRALQADGEVVGMLGDGVNDAAALKGADVGVAMGRRGTDVAKETADLVLLDDRLATVAAAVEGGRVIDDDIRKVVFYLFSGNLSEVLVLLVAGVCGLPLPLLPLQILWINLVSDVFPALALAMEPGEPDVMRRPPVRGTAVLSRRFAVSATLYGLLLALPALGVFLIALRRDGDEARARALAFLVLGLGQIAHAFNARSRGRAPLRSVLSGTRWMWGATAIGAVLMLGSVAAPGLGRVLGVPSLHLDDGVLVACAALLPLVVGRIWHRVRVDAPLARSSSH
ncbi:MAG: cation-transporting P-type ATPase [Planctomycetes bacterium]|nr:cation-transporting P-type ATPase [Planctomycetota bacterium]